MAVRYSPWRSFPHRLQLWALMLMQRSSRRWRLSVPNTQLPIGARSTARPSGNLRVIDWQAEAELLVDRVTHAALSTAVTRDHPNDRLFVVSVAPSAAGAARMRLVVSAHELIISAGRVTRFELNALPASRNDATKLMLAVVAGDLTEKMGTWGVRFNLVLPDESTRTGRTIRGLLPRPRRTRVIAYQAYESG
jgi:hypothetical protein